MKKLAIVILNYNGKQHLSHFLPSVVRHSQPHDIVVIDNGSYDDSVLWVQNQFPEIRIILLSENYGFALGYNEGLKEIQGQYEQYLLLNSDVEVTENYLIPLLDRLKSPEIAAVQPKILSYNQKNTFEHAGAAGGFLDINGFPFCRGRVFNHCEEDQGQYNDAIPVFWASGACLLIKSEVFHAVNGFDSSFYAHMEEIDLCWRIQNQGYQIWVEPLATVYHLGGGTLSYDSPKKLYLNFRNNLFMLIKNQRGCWLCRVLIRMLWDGIAGLQFLFKGKVTLFWQVIKAHLSVYWSLPRLLRQRKTHGQKAIHGRVNYNIVLQYYLKQKKTFNDITK